MECQEKCECGKVCGRVDKHTEHQCQECNYDHYWNEHDQIKRDGG